MKLLNDAGLVTSNGEARRLIKQGGCYVKGERIENADVNIDDSFLEDCAVLIRLGKKKYSKVLFE